VVETRRALPPALAAQMWQAIPELLTALSDSALGPVVGAPQRGNEQRNPARFERSSLVVGEKFARVDAIYRIVDKAAAFVFDVGTGACRNVALASRKKDGGPAPFFNRVWKW